MMIRQNRRLIVGLVSTTLYFLAAQLVMSILARYSRDLGISIANTSLIWATVFLVSFILRPVAGYVADKTSSYLTMALGGLFMVISSVIYLQSKVFSDLLIGRILQGIAAACFISPSIAAVAMAAGESAGMALGIRSMLISIASIISPLIAGFIADSIGYSLVFIIAILLAIILTILNVFEVKQRYIPPKSTESFRSSWHKALNKTTLIMMIVALFCGMFFSSVSGILQAHYRDLGYEAKTYSYFLMFFGIGSAISRYIAGKLSMQKNPALIAIMGHIIVTSAIFMLRNMYLAPSSYIVAIIYGFGIGLTVPTQQLIVLSSVPKDVKNTAISIYIMGFDFGGFIGPTIYGYIASIYGYVTSYQYIVLAPITALILLIYLITKRKSL